MSVGLPASLDNVLISAPSTHAHAGWVRVHSQTPTYPSACLSCLCPISSSLGGLVQQWSPHTLLSGNPWLMFSLSARTKCCSVWLHHSPCWLLLEQHLKWYPRVQGWIQCAGHRLPWWTDNGSGWEHDPLHRKGRASSYRHLRLARNTHTQLELIVFIKEGYKWLLFT